jgi:hypothetical protein
VNVFRPPDAEFAMVSACVAAFASSRTPRRSSTCDDITKLIASTKAMATAAEINKKMSHPATGSGSGNVPPRERLSFGGFTAPVFKLVTLRCRRPPAAVASGRLRAQRADPDDGARRRDLVEPDVEV